MHDWREQLSCTIYRLEFPLFLRSTSLGHVMQLLDQQLTIASKFHHQIAEIILLCGKLIGHM